MKECYKCGFNDEDYGCTCPSVDKWYACPIDNKRPENIQAMEDYAEWASEVSYNDDGSSIHSEVYKEAYCNE